MELIDAEAEVFSTGSLYWLADQTGLSQVHRYKTVQRTVVTRIRLGIDITTLVMSSNPGVLIRGVTTFLKPGGQDLKAFHRAPHSTSDRQ